MTSMGVAKGGRKSDIPAGFKPKGYHASRRTSDPTGLGADKAGPLHHPGGTLGPAMFGLHLDNKFGKTLDPNAAVQKDAEVYPTL